MTTFYLFEKLNEDSCCDHTIQCGERLTKLNASTVEDAITEAFVDGEPLVDIEERYKEMRLLVVTSEHDLMDELKQARARFYVRALEDAKAKDKAKRAEYERLKDELATLKTDKEKRWERLSEEFTKLLREVVGGAK